MIFRKRPRTPLGTQGETALPEGYDYRFSLNSDGEWKVDLFDYNVWPKELVATQVVGEDPLMDDFIQGCKKVKEGLDNEDWFWYPERND